MFKNHLKSSSFKSFIKKQFSTSNNNSTYDLCIIGGGPAGYIAAIKAGQKNLKAVCVEKRTTLGGTCLNVGCIPSKALLNTSLKYYEAKHQFSELGIKADNVGFDLEKIMKHKSKVVSSLCGGIEGLFKKNKVEYRKGAASFKDEHTIEVLTSEGKKELITAKNFIIATGSYPNELPGGFLKTDEKTVVSSTGALSLTKVPEKLVVVGAGVIGLELGSVYSRLGSTVEVIEYANKILPPFDNEVSSTFQKLLTKQGFIFHLGTKVVGGKVQNNGKVKLDLEIISSNKKAEMEADIVLVSTGRRPYTDNLGLEKIGIKTDKVGRIPIDSNWRTEKKHIYAIGDVVEGPMLAHKGEEEGVAAVNHICGEYGHVNYNNIPNVVYTHPEIASIGFTEEELKEKSKLVFNLLIKDKFKYN